MLTRSMRACQRHITMAIQHCQIAINTKAFRERNKLSALTTLEERWHIFKSAFLDLVEALREENANDDAIRAVYDECQTHRLL